MLKELTVDEKNIISNYIKSQPIKVVEEFDFEKKKITYSKEITGRDVKIVFGDEEIVRAYFLTKLVNELGYKPKKIEIEKEYTAGRPHTNTSRIDVIVRDNNNDAFLFIELKSPKEYSGLDIDLTIEEQLFKVAGMEKTDGEGHNVKYLVLYTIDIENEIISDECIIIDNEKYTTFSQWEVSRGYTDEIPKKYGKAQKTPYIKGSKKDLEKNFSHETLDKLQKDLHNTLWGGGGTDDNEIFSSLTNLILAKIQDEDEKRDGDLYDFQSLVFAKEDTEVYETNEELFEKINKLYKRALVEKLNITDKEELNKSYVVDTKKFSLSKLKYTVQQLERFSFVDGKNSISGKDILGDFFEGIIRTGFKQTKGQFFTHINIVRFMLWAIQADKLAIERINKSREIPFLIDPSAGSGTFLIEYMKFITQNVKYRFNDKLDTSRAVQDKIKVDWFYPDHRENRWAREYIYGCELNFNLGTATKVNMILHGDGSTNIFVGAQKGDGLLPFKDYEKATAPNALNKETEDKLYCNIVNGQFDLILTNPPFSVDLDRETKIKVGKYFIFGDNKKSENLFIERYYQLLKENGRLAVILPESVFDTTENKYIRLFIYKYFNVKAIVSLPLLTFAPYTNTKTSIFFAQKKTSKEIVEWNTLWAKYSKEYSNLKTRIENLLKVYSVEKKKSKLPSIKDLTEQDINDILHRFLKNYITEDDKKLTNDGIIGKYKDELNDLCKYDKDTEKEFGFVNTWWVFTEVSKELNYSIFMAEVDNVGYKRSKRGEKTMPNNLYRTDEEGIVLVDDGVKETVLDYMREIRWKGMA